MKKVTTAEIAKRANVSRATVSYVLNGKEKEESIPEVTASRVRAIAEELGWVPNFAASSLVRRKSDTIGIILVNIEEVYFSGIVKGIDLCLREHNYRFIMRFSYSDVEAEATGIRDLVSYNCEGFIIFPTVGDVSQYALLDSRDIPYVCIDRQPEGARNFVTTDDYSGMRALMTHLYDECGKRDFICFGTFLHLPVGQARRAGVREFVQEKNDVAYYEVAEENGNYQAVLDDIIAHIGDDTTIITFVDHQAAQLMGALRTRGVRIPEDVSLTGYCDTFFAQYLTPPLTTVHQPALEVGRRATELVLDLIEKKEEREKEHVIKVPVTLSLRNSVRCAHDFDAG